MGWNDRTGSYNLSASQVRSSNPRRQEPVLDSRRSRDEVGAQNYLRYQAMLERQRESQLRAAGARGERQPMAGQWYRPGSRPQGTPNPSLMAEFYAAQDRARRAAANYRKYRTPTAAESERWKRLKRGGTWH